MTPPDKAEYDNQEFIADMDLIGMMSKEEEKMGEVKRTERGWAGHFCCAEMCRFRRNTLLEYNGKAIVVSTVGAMYNSRGDLEEIGLGRHYETMAFYADDSEYKDASVSDEICFDSPWSLKWHKDGYIDNEANAMHEKVVEELSEKLLKGEIYMTKEELEKQTMEWKNKYILKLEKENTELKDKLNNLASVAEVRLANWQKYEKENTELKARLNAINLLTPELEKQSKARKKQLTEAKDLIRNLLRITYGEGWNYSLDWKVKAEKFLKE